MIYIFIFLHVVVNVFSKYNIQSITVLSGKKKINLNHSNLLAPFQVPSGSFLKLNVFQKNKRFLKKKNIKFKIYDETFIKNQKGRILIFQKLPLNDYVLSVLASELGNTKLKNEALKAFYLVIKNFTLNNLKKHEKIGADFCDIAHCQLYIINPIVFEKRKRFEKKLNSVLNKKIYYRDKLAETFYSSSCGSYICSSESIWKKRLPYLKFRRLDTDFDKWEFRLEKKLIFRIYRKNKLDEEIISKACSLKREKLKNTVNSYLGWNKIKSNAFEVKEYNGFYLLKGSGFGHNVGFCLKEADFLAQKGLTYKEIIKFFFEGSEVK